MTPAEIADVYYVEARFWVNESRTAQSNVELLQRAFELYMEGASVGGLHAIEGYTGAASIMALFGLHEHAQGLLTQAATLSPANLDVVRCKTRIDRMAKQPQFQASSPIVLNNSLTRLRDTDSPVEEALHLCQQWLATKQSFDLPPWDELFN